MGTMKRTIAERFASKYRVDAKSGCWVWSASIDGRGYGQISNTTTKKPMRAHRVSYELHVGVIPHGTMVLHRCDRPACVNPEHLFLGTQIDNMQDCANKGRNAAARHPENMSRGDAHYSRAKPWLLARGDRNGSRLHPETKPRGDNHYSRRTPEKMARGSRHGNARLTVESVQQIRSRVAAGETQDSVARDLGVSRPTVTAVVARRNWAHVP